MSVGGRDANRHGWNSLDKHLQTQEKHLEDRVGGFVLAYRLQAASVSWRQGGRRRQQFDGARKYRVSGRVVCRHGLFIQVDKTLEVNAERQSRTIAYSYHAAVRGPQDRPIFRYDNAHRYAGHLDSHHRHRFDCWTWREIGQPVWVGEGQWPHLSDVVDELDEWWEREGRFLGLVVPDDDDESDWWGGSDTGDGSRVSPGPTPRR